MTKTNKVPDRYGFIDAQVGIHLDLERLVISHCSSVYRRPIADHTRVAFDQFLKFTVGARPVILDAGCGTGLSTRLLAERYKDAVVIGVDRSAARLKNATGGRDNYRILRANLVDLWRLMAASDIRVKKTYLLYPNPYPKRSQLRSRWHGHPIFHQLLATTEAIELRSNWQVYVAEFAQAVSLVKSRFGLRPESEVSDEIESYHTHTPITVFERRYLTAACPVYRYFTKLR